MPITDGFDPAHPLPFAFDDRIEPRGIGNAGDGAVVPSRVLKASVLIAAVTATGIAVLTVGNPVALYADVTAALFGNPEPQSDANQSTPAIQSFAAAPVSVQATADPQALPPAATEVPTRDEVAAAEPAAGDTAENGATASEVLFRQFQAWAAENDAQASIRPPPVQDAPAAIPDPPAPIMKEAAGRAPVPHRLQQKQRRLLPVRNARAEARTENARKKVRRAPGPRAERPPVEDAATQGQSAQNAEAPSFLTSLGLRN